MNEQYNKILSPKIKQICVSTTAVKLLSGITSLIMASMIACIVNAATAPSVERVLYYSAVSAAVLIAATIIQTSWKIALNRRKMVVDSQCKLSFLKRLLQNSKSQLVQTSYGEISENLTNDMDTLIKQYAETLPNTLSSLLVFFGYSVFLMLSSPVTAITLILLSLLQLLPPVIVKKCLKINYEENRIIEEQITNHIIEAVEGFDEIKIYNLKSWWISKMKGLHSTYLRVGQKADATAAVQRGMFRLTDNILKYGTYAIMGIYVVVGWSTLENAVQAVYLSTGLFEAVRNVFLSVPEFAIAKVASQRINKWSETDVLTAAKRSDSSTIMLKSVSYYRDGACIFNDLSYEFNSKETYLIVGENGSGKTTLLRIVNELLLPTVGKVISNINHYNSFFIPQEEIWFSFEAASLFEMIDLCKYDSFLSVAYELGLTNEQIFQTKIRDLSGGERKKVWLAIAFGKSPEWLLLDEPTNSLDNIGKKTVYNYLERRSGTIVISHDIEMTEKEKRLFHRILNVHNGGIHEEN